MPKTPKDLARAPKFARAMARNAFGKNFSCDEHLAEIRRASTKPPTPTRPIPSTQPKR